MDSNYINVFQIRSSVRNCVGQEQRQGQMQMFSVPPPSILPQQTGHHHSNSIIEQYSSVPLLMVPPPSSPVWLCSVPSPVGQMHYNFSYSSGITMTTTRSNNHQGELSSSSVTSSFEFKLASITGSNPPSITSTAVPEQEAMTKNETTSTPPSCSQKRARNSSSDNILEQFHELVKTALDGCKKAEALATCHQKRPCFKKIDSLCARLKQDLVKTDNVMSNINSQGLAWAVKDFIFVFTRIMNAWIIIKGYVHTKPDGLASIQRELCPNFLDAFGRWHEATHELIQSLIKSFINLNKLAKQQRGGGSNIFTKVDDSKDDSAGQASNTDPLDDIEEAESSLNLSDGAYIRAGIYPNISCPPPGFPEKPSRSPFAGYKQQQQQQQQSNNVKLLGDRLQASEPTPPPSTISPVGFNRPEYKKESCAISNNVQGSENVDRQYMNHLHRKTSLECINWVLEEVRAIEEGQYFYCINFTKNYFPDYVLLISKTTMDLRTVYKKHDAGRYSMLVELLDDLQQIVDTCKRYVEASTEFDLWKPNDLIRSNNYSLVQRKEMEHFPKMQTFVAKMEHLFAAIRKDRTMDDREMSASSLLNFLTGTGL